ncbi:YihY/virulence factor BrkB family protein [Streptomyces sp. NPDC050287]|uniref:YihY/virulence factor BrkB family protein n=1 Tax=Streptomyces sp. NPDC050287 TaxID=3365608 RepID=UPI0037A93488
MEEKAAQAGKTVKTEKAQKADKDSPSALPAPSWWAVLRRTSKELLDDELSDRAAALTYYSVLSLFPALLLLVSLLGVVGQRATDKILDNIGDLAPGPARDILRDAVVQLGDSGGTGSVLAVLGLLFALWSASGYVAAFIRTSNAVYDLPEGRPVWKLTPLRLALTVALMLMLAASAVIVVFTGPLAERAGRTIGFGAEAIAVWGVAKWPVLLLLVIIMIGLLYWAAPNVRGRGFRWISPGSVLATLIWLAASAGFALYAANFGTYNKTYGTLAGAIVFLVWLWLSNLAILLGLEFDAELARERAIIREGLPPTEEPYVEPRDTRTWPARLRAARGKQPKVS